MSTNITHKPILLLTGGTGFLGKYLIESLVADYQLRVLIRKPARFTLHKSREVELVEGDIRNVGGLEAAMQGVDYVVHAAAVGSFWKRRRKLMWETNVYGTQNIVNMALGAGVKKLVYISSIAALGRVEGAELIDEEAEWKDGKLNSFYAKSKYYGEKEVHRGVQEGLPAVICNPGVIIGAGNWKKGTPRFFSLARKGLRWYPKGTNGFVGAEDVAKAVEILLKSEFEVAERFVLVEKSLSYRSFLTKVAAAVGQKPPRWAVSGWLLRIGGSILEFFANFTGKEPVISRESSRFSHCAFTYAGDKITEKTSFRYTPIEEVISLTGEIFNRGHETKN